MRELLARNQLAAEDLVSCIFTLTTTSTPSSRRSPRASMGLSRVPLLCAREIPVPGALPRVIRVLIHCYPPEGSNPSTCTSARPAKLRLDLEGAQ